MSRNMRMLHGRRVRLGDLLQADLLKDGEEVLMTVAGQAATATVVLPGRIRLTSGQEFQTPSPAAAAAIGSGSLDGWNYWRTAAGRTLDALRQDLLDRVAADSEGSDESEEPGVLTPAGSVWLKGVRDRALGGHPTTVPLRNLLSYWGLDRRDSVASNHVVEALAERGLEATPSVLATSLDDVVVVGLAGKASSDDDGSADNGDSGSGLRADGGVAVGLVLSSFMDTDRPLISVQPQHTLGQARSGR